MQSKTKASPVKGTTLPAYEAVRAAFEDNLSSGLKLGGHFAVYRDGDAIVDLWGGHMGRDTNLRIQEDSLYTIFSATKGVFATAVAMLVNRGKLHYDDRVSSHWPEFGQNGKDHLTVGQAMSHQVGLAAFHKPITMTDLYDHDAAASTLAAQKPDFTPGVWAYHALASGVIADEIIRRVDGRTFKQFFRDELAPRLGNDLLIGLPEDEDDRHVGLEIPSGAGGVAYDPPMPAMFELTMTNPPTDLDWANWRVFREAGIPSAGGSANARGLAKMYAAIVSDTAPLLSRAVFKEATCQRVSGVDQGSGGIGRYAAGYRMNVGDMGASPDAFGHPGIGGTIGFGDPARHIGVAYTSSRAGSPDWQRPDPRLIKLLVAFYKADAAAR